MLKVAGRRSGHAELAARGTLDLLVARSADRLARLVAELARPPGASPSPPMVDASPTAAANDEAKRPSTLAS